MRGVAWSCVSFLLFLFSMVPGDARASQAETPAARVGPANALTTTGSATDLSKASPEQLLRVYGQLRSLSGSGRYAAVTNVVWKRDAGTFTFRNGRLAFAAPVQGHVLAAVFTGDGTFELTPPGAIEQHQIARFTKRPKLEDNFREAFQKMK